MNWQTIVVLALVAAAVGAIVTAGIRKRKKGGSSCSCGCEGCSLKGSCHR